MLFVWTKGMNQPTAFKCHDIPTNGSGNPQSFLAKHMLTPEQEGLSIKDLAQIYPAPEYADV